jgi:Sulfotransferase family
MIRQMAGASLKVLYVGGYARSGSTLLSRVLGESPGMVCIGETRYLWSRGLLNNVDCGCGVPFRSCPFWSAVGDEAFGGWDRVDAERLTEIDRVTNLPQALPLHWAPWLRRGMRDTISDYADRLAELYAAIARVSGAKMIVEMSKDATFACLLRRIPDSDVRVVHLVRDSRAVAYSWARKRRMPSPIGAQVFMPQSGPLETATKWLAWNTSLHVLAAARFPYLKLNYESFVADPRGALQKISAFAGEALVPSYSELTDTEVKLGDHHIFSGNPMRATTGWLPIRIDNEWQTQLTTAQFAKVTGLTWPLLSLYGYPLVPAARRASGVVVGNGQPG